MLREKGLWYADLLFIVATRQLTSFHQRRLTPCCKRGMSYGGKDYYLVRHRRRAAAPYHRHELLYVWTFVGQRASLR